MKTIAILVITVCVLLAAGCTTTPPATTPPVPVTPAVTLPGMALPGQGLPMNETVTLGSGNNTMEVSLYTVEVDPPTDPGTHTITVRVIAKNTGTTPRKFVWFSKLTNLNGNSFGGIGISHGGNGARSDTIYPGIGEGARDYIIIRSDESLATLSKGAVLNVYFMERTDNKTSMVPDYHVTWNIDPGVIT
jgi:hypothetical protein